MPETFYLIFPAHGNKNRLFLFKEGQFLLISLPALFSYFFRITWIPKSFYIGKAILLHGKIRHLLGTAEKKISFFSYKFHITSVFYFFKGVTGTDLFLCSTSQSIGNICRHAKTVRNICIQIFLKLCQLSAPP